MPTLTTSGYVVIAYRTTNYKAFVPTEQKSKKCKNDVFRGNQDGGVKWPDLIGYEIVASAYTISNYDVYKRFSNV